MGIDSLPKYHTSFLGREREIHEVNALLDTSDCRIITLIGPGGIGKTRIAIEVATHQIHSFTDGVYFVALQPLKSVENIQSAIVEVLPLQLQDTGRNAEDQLIDYLREKRLLIIMDNFEHLVEGAELLTRLVQNSPKLKILATSREVLNLRLEWLRPVQGLTVPATDTFHDSDATRLFIERAKRVQPDFSADSERPHILKICEIVDGMPLAIELAAGWLHSITCAEVAHELQQNIDILTTKQRDRSVRHRSIRAVFNHSWHLLNTAERRVLAYASVFRGGFTRSAAEFVSGASLGNLTALVEKSILYKTASGRYYIHELLRQYAEEQLHKGDETRDALDVHSQYYATHLLSMSRLEVLQQGIGHLVIEVDNIRLAVETALKYGTPERFGKNYFHLYWLYEFNAWYEEGARTFLALVNAFEHVPKSEEQQLYLGGTLSNYAWFLHRLNRDDEIEPIIARSIALLDGVDHKTPWYGVAATLVFARALEHDVEIVIQRCLDIIEQFEKFNLDWAVAWIKNGLGERLNAFGRHDEALQQLVTALPIQRYYKMPLGILWCLEGLGRAHLELGNHMQAHQHIEEALEVANSHRWQYFECSLRVILGEIYTALGTYNLAKDEFISAFEFTRDMGDHRWSLNITAHIARIYLLEKRFALALDYAHFTLDHPLQNEDAKEIASTVLEAISERDDIDTGFKTSLTLADVAHQLKNERNFLRGYNEQEIANQALIEPLTERELEVLQHIAMGMSNQEIADQLFVGVSTVKKHITHINAKLNVKSRTQAVALARELNLL